MPQSDAGRHRQQITIQVVSNGYYTFLGQVASFTYDVVFSRHRITVNKVYHHLKRNIVSRPDYASGKYADARAQFHNIPANVRLIV